MPALGTTGLQVHPLCLGGNVFGWTADEEQTFAVLDAYTAAGGTFIDTADGYSSWVPGNQGGESEALIGRWMASRGNRDELVLATKVGMKPGLEGLGADTVRRAADASLGRLGTDRIDLYYAHRDDPDTPLEESLGAFDALVQEGKVRHLGASNYTADRLEAALQVSDREGLARFAVLQPKYNVMDRETFEGPLQDLCAAQDIAVVPYSGLASGFLTGKYRPGGEAVSSPRAGSAAKYLERGGDAVLAVLDELAAEHAVPLAAVALAWLAAQETVATPIASARTVEQLQEQLPLDGLVLGAGELQRLDGAVG